MDELRIGALPRELIPGDSEAITQLARRLQDIAVGCEDAANQLRGLRADDWQGEAAEAYADALDQEPSKYVRAAEAFHDAALAVQRYAATLEEAQHDARRAILLFEEAMARAQKATADTSGNVPVPDAVASAQPPAVDPDIARARTILNAARERVEHESDIAAGHLSDAAEAAPNKPGWGSRFLHGAGEFFGGVADATWGTGKFLWSVSQVRMVVDPEGWIRDVKGIGEGVAWGASHPSSSARRSSTGTHGWRIPPGRPADSSPTSLCFSPPPAPALPGAVPAPSKKAADAAENLRAAERAADAAEDLRAAERAADAAEEARAAKRAADLADHKPRRSPTMDEARRARLHQDGPRRQGPRKAGTRRRLERTSKPRGILPGVDRPEG